MKNYYKIMGVNKNASDSEIKQAYRKLAKTLHPDVNRTNPQAESQLADLNEAYEVLSDSKKRKEYDAQLANTVVTQRTHGAGAGFNTGGSGAHTARNSSANAEAIIHQAHAQAAAAAQAAGGTIAATIAANKIALDNAVNTAYNAAYANGYNDASARYEEEGKKYRSDIITLQRQARDAKREVSEAQKELAEQAVKISEMVSASEKLTQAATESIKSEKDKEYAKIIEQLKFELNVANTHLERTKEKLKASEEATYSKDQQITELFEANKRLSEKIADLEDFADSVEKSEDIERIIFERQLKLKEDKKRFKDTPYGVLSVNFWASTEEIKANYEKLRKRFQNKVANGEENAGKKLNNIEKAYKILSNDEQRIAFNESLGITDDDIAREIQLEQDYNSIVEHYEQEKADTEFWNYIDDLMMMAQSGDSIAQNELGELYYYGDELEKDLSLAVYWFKESAKQHELGGLFNLGKCYFYGEGLPKDTLRGMSLIRQAAKMGHAPAEEFVKNNKN